MRRLLAQFGIPETLITDGDLRFISTEFTNPWEFNTYALQFVTHNQVVSRTFYKHIKGNTQKSSRRMNWKCLTAHRSTPKAAIPTDAPPAEVLLGRCVRIQSYVVCSTSVPNIRNDKVADPFSRHFCAKPRFLTKAIGSMSVIFISPLTSGYQGSLLAVWTRSHRVRRDNCTVNQHQSHERTRGYQIRRTKQSSH